MKPKNLIVHTTGLQVNATGSLPEWIQLAPYGEHPTRDRASVQVFNAAIAEQLVNAFHGIFAKITRVIGLNTVPIWKGHPDFAPTEWPEKIRLGSITDLAAREDGLWGKAEWNAEAEREIKENRHRFASSAWDVEELSPGKIQPVILWSVGMWHQPNIKSVLPVVNAGTEEEDTEAKKESDKEKETKPEPTKPMNADIIKALIEAGLITEGTDEVTATTALLSHLKDIAKAGEDKKKAEDEAANLKLEVEKKDGEAEEMKSQINALRTKAAGLVIKSAIETGRITEAEKAGFETEINADFEAGIQKITSLTPKLNTQGINLNRSREAVLNAAERQTKISDWVNTYMEAKSVSYNTAFNACKQAPEMKAIWEQVDKK